MRKNMSKIVHIGMDVGSTTVKIAVMDENLNEIHTSYERHYSDTKNTVCKVLEELVEKYKDKEFTIALTGSGAMSTARFLDIPFIQEVVACKRAVEKYIPQTDVVIELGGEEEKALKQAVAGRMGDEELSQEVNDIVNNVNQK